MAADGKIHKELERMFLLVGNLQDQQRAFATDVMTLSLKADKLADHTKELMQNTRAVEQEDNVAVLEEEEGGVGKSTEKENNQKPLKIYYKGNKYWMTGTWLAIEKEDRRDFFMGSLEDLGIIKLYKVNDGAFGLLGTFGLKRNMKYHLGSVLEFRGLAGRNADPTEIESLRDIKFKIKDCQQNRLRGSERELRASDVRDPG